MGFRWGMHVHASANSIFMEGVDSLEHLAVCTKQFSYLEISCVLVLLIIMMLIAPGWIVLPWQRKIYGGPEGHSPLDGLTLQLLTIKQHTHFDNRWSMVQHCVTIDIV